MPENRRLICADCRCGIFRIVAVHDDDTFMNNEGIAAWLECENCNAEMVAVVDVVPDGLEEI